MKSEVLCLSLAVLLLAACDNPAPVPSGPGTPAGGDAGEIPDAGETNVTACLFIGGIDRIAFDRPLEDGAACARLLLSNGTPDPDAGLETPAGFTMQSATYRQMSCPSQVIGMPGLEAASVTGWVRFPPDAGAAYPPTASLDVTLQFDGGPGEVRMVGSDVPLEQGPCL